MSPNESKRSSGRVTPKGGAPVATRRTARQRRVSWVAGVIVVLVLAGLVAGTLGTAIVDTPAPTTTLPR